MITRRSLFAGGREPGLGRRTGCGTSARGRVAHSGVVTGAQPAKKVTAAIQGARHVRIVVTNGGDNAYFDHADLADATITCT